MLPYTCPFPIRLAFPMPVCLPICFLSLFYRVILQLGTLHILSHLFSTSFPFCVCLTPHITFYFFDIDLVRCIWHLEFTYFYIEETGITLWIERFKPIQHISLQVEPELRVEVWEYVAMLVQDTIF
jgi:hypothetical protein